MSSRRCGHFGRLPNRGIPYGTGLAELFAVALSRALIVSVVGVGCVAAAGVGGYLAVKSGASTAAETVAVRQPAAPESLPSPVPTAVPEHEPAEAAPMDTPAPLPGTDATAKPALPSITRSPARAAKPAVRSPASIPGSLPSVPDTISAPEAALEDVGTSVSDLPQPTPEPIKPTLEELTIPSNAVIGFRLDAPVSSFNARVEDRVTAHVTRDVAVNGRTAIPAGSRLEGNVTVVDHGGKFKNAARLGIRFMTVILADNTRVPIQTETIFRDGEPPGNEAASKIGASAVVGTILGAVLGGKKGAAIGTTMGAAGGTAAVAAGDANEAVIAAGVPLTVRLTSPATVVVDKGP